eukprot:CAMPEP_0119071726 /NCGR_PEP_ID=MMETSP1178-20130426/53675_1 /TAXON_ID=33656 /ORGANISM="unid sp, Strain CCMP2000" /LENGTH=204 /DNA_ID=CAMNT_0007053683 /DNA_START=76 /DNA_END=690 /DNA_ORIENTATION=+
MGRSAPLAVLASISLALSSGSVLRGQQFAMRKLASSGAHRFEYVGGHTRAGLHERAGRMLRGQHALPVPWTDSLKSAVMRTNLPTLEPLLLPALSIPLQRCQLMLAALFALTPGVPVTVREPAPTQSVVSTDLLPTSFSEAKIVFAAGGELTFAQPSCTAEVIVAGLKQTIDEQSQHIKTLEAAVDALRGLVCIMCGIVAVICI